MRRLPALKARRWVSWALLTAGATLLVVTSAGAQEPSPVRVLRLEGIVDPITAGYVERGVGVGEREGAEIIVLEMDTPGGLDTAMRRIVQALLNAQVPTAVYVSPPGARAASAGVLITAAGHFAAMAPGTNIGAAHPVGLGEELPEDLSQKATNDAVAYVRSIADLRGRNADWLEDAVRRSVSATAGEALELGVIDLVSADLDDLLSRLDGRSTRIGDAEVTLHTAGAPVRRMGMNFAERILHFVVDPNVAFFLLSIGSLGILVELYNPGGILPGIVGVISLVLAFVGLYSLPLNWAGLALMVLAIVLFLLELQAPGYGVLGVGGAASFVVGALLLYAPFSPGSPALPQIAVSLWLLGPMTAVVAGFFLFVVGSSIRARRTALRAERELVGSVGYAATALDPQGTVQVASELWSAQSEEGTIAASEPVEVVDRKGLRLVVRRAPKDGVGRPSEDGGQRKE